MVSDTKLILPCLHPGFKDATDKDYSLILDYDSQHKLNSHAI